MADNFTFKDASGSNQTARAKDNSSVYVPGTFLVAPDGTFPSDDDAAIAGGIAYIGGLYEATRTELDDGDGGRLASTIRRALVNNPDTSTYVAFNSGGTGGATDGDIRDTSNHLHTMSTNHPGALAGQRIVGVSNGLDQNITFSIFASIAGLGVHGTIYTATINTATDVYFVPFAGGTGTDLITVAALGGPVGDRILFQITAASTPTSGTCDIIMQWRA